jgi:hypothetical protein
MCIRFADNLFFLLQEFKNEVVKIELQQTLNVDRRGHPGPKLGTRVQSRDLGEREPLFIYQLLRVFLPIFCDLGTNVAVFCEFTTIFAYFQLNSNIFKKQM